MTHLPLHCLSILVITTILAVNANANPVQLDVSFTVSGESGDYLYDFTITNDSLEPIEVYALFLNDQNLAIESSPTGWAPALPAAVEWCTDGDCLDTTGGVQPGASVSGFVVRDTSEEPLDEASWTVGIAGPTVALLGLPVTLGDTAMFNGRGFVEGATGKYKIEIITPDSNRLAQAFGINDSGTIVGNSNSEVDSTGYIYDPETCSYTHIGDSFLPLEINNAGVSVGTTGIFFESSLCTVRDELGHVTTFQPPTPSVGCEARGINSNGQISGNTFDENGVWRGFLYDTQSETFEEFLPSPQTFASGLNDAGGLVGSVFLQAGVAFPGSDAGRYGYLRTPDGTFKYFSIAQSFPAQSRARGLSNSGLVSGWYIDNDTFEFKSYVTRLANSTDYEEITLTDADIIFSKPCNLNLPAPPSPNFELFTDVFASQVRDDGVVVGTCNDFYRDGAVGIEINYRSGFLATPTGGSEQDTDGDGVGDAADNCPLDINQSQADTDDDGIGNACDADFNNDCVVNFLDYALLADQFLSTDTPLYDLNSDGVVNFIDLSVLTDYFLMPPGPGSVGNVCETD